MLQCFTNLQIGEIMDKKKWLFWGIFLTVILVITSLIVLKHCGKSSTEREIDRIKKQLVKQPKFDDSLYVNVDVTLQNEVVYVFDVKAVYEDINDLKLVIISPDDNNLLLTYGFYQDSDVLVVSKENDNEVEKIRLLTSSSASIDEFYIYLSYNNSVEYLKVVLGD